MATKAIVGEKVGMTQVWDEDNRVVPVTVLRVTPCRVVQVKTPETDGYSAIQVTLGVKDANKLTQPEAGHFAKAGVDAGRKLVELRLDDVSENTSKLALAVRPAVAPTACSLTPIWSLSVAAILDWKWQQSGESLVSMCVCWKWRSAFCSA